MKKDLCRFILGMLACIIFGYFVVFFYNRNQLYELDFEKNKQAENNYNNYNVSFRLSSDMVSLTNEILGDISYEEYEEKIQYYRNELISLSKYKNLIIEKKADEAIANRDRQYILIDGQRYTVEEIRETAELYKGYTEAWIDEHLELYNIVYRSLEFAKSYETYVNYIVENSRKLSSLKVFGDDVREDIKSKGADYLALTEVRARAYIFAGIEKLFDDPFGDLMAVLMVAICSFIAASHLKTAGVEFFSRNLNKVFRILFLVGVLLLFISEAMAINRTFEIGGLRSPMQSVPGYRLCTLDISVGMLLVIRTAIKCVVYYMLFLGLQLVLVYFFIHKESNDGIPELKSIKRNTVCFFAILSLAVLLEFVVLKYTDFDLRALFGFERIVNNSYKNILIFSTATGILLLFLILFLEYGYKRLINIEKTRSEQRYIKEIDEKYNEMRTIKHDMNNHLSAILFLMDAGKNDEAKKYIRELTGAASVVSDIKKTGVRALDLLLWNKASQALSKNIDLKMILEDEYTDIGVSEYELCSMYANILDNAMEAVEKLDVADRFISLRSQRQMELMCIFCENPYKDVSRENGSFVSTKADKVNHGLGLKQIQRIAEKHGGTVRIETNDGMFKISVILNV